MAWIISVLSLIGIYLLNSLSSKVRLWGWLISLLASIGYSWLYIHTNLWGLLIASLGWFIIEIRGIYICYKDILDKSK